ncbi:polyprenol monophosphomannose synthase [Changpingibacter yushuensis]|uniref:polyprenol monophosphomannose synthase n=1 Tax=Changpingibacter yushuensis TaxID=2758440 RepID=UPI0015F504FD|nr:polyprenol monophosphomannose synthase [Changpingibacter yushuensis]
MKVLITIPTYNERESIEPIVKRARAAVPEADILIVDDNSPDGTGEIADQLAAADEHVKVLHRAGKEGLGRAYIDAFRWAMGQDYTHVVEMDADGSHRPEQLPLLLERAAMSDYPDLVIGSRYVRGGELEGWPKSREVLSRAGNLYIKLWLGLPAADVTAGFRVYAVSMLERLDLDSVEAKGYFFQTDMTDHVHRMHGHIVEMPISFAQREAGESKLSKSVFTESLARTTKIGAQRRGNQLLGLGEKVLGRIKGH